MESQSVNITADISEQDFDQIKVLADRKELDFTDVRKEQFFAIHDDDNVIGFARIRNREGIKELCTVGVKKACRNKGIGAELIGFATHREKDLYVITIIPDYFKKFGFVEIYDIPSVFNDKLENSAFWHGYGTPVVMQHKRSL